MGRRFQSTRSHCPRQNTCQVQSVFCGLNTLPNVDTPVTRINHELVGERTIHLFTVSLCWKGNTSTFHVRFAWTPENTTRDFWGRNINLHLPALPFISVQEPNHEYPVFSLRMIQAKKTNHLWTQNSLCSWTNSLFQVASDSYPFQYQILSCLPLAPHSQVLQHSMCSHFLFVQDPGSWYGDKL